MRLKRVELQGFKSFADAAQIEIAPGLTAIVGPNGCGKSNIVDAIRWVLGEQSWKTLRGNRLEDAIFSGSESRRALSFAEVQLVVENDDGALPVDFHEVTVARKGFRSGESRAYLNRTECRLRDLQELFMDTGLGGGAFSVVGQGEIEHVLSAKPEELRVWLEETAGIAKVRTKRREALKRLDETDQDLVRIEDLRAEGERRLAPLIQEAERAEAYERLTREAKLLELLLLSGRYRLLTQEGATRREQAARRAAERDEARRALAAASGRRAELSAEQDALDRELQATGDRRSAEDRTLAEVRQEIALAEQERGHAASEKERVREARAGHEARAEQLRRETADLAAQLTRLKEQVDDRRGELQTAGGIEAQEALQASEAQLARAREQLLLAVRERSAAEARAAAIEERLDGVSESENELREALAASERADAAARRRAEEAERRAEEVRGRAVRLNEKREALRRSIREELEPERKRLATELQSVQDDVQRTRARQNALEEMERSRQGYARGVRSVLDGRRRLGDGILGVVADLLEVDDRWETAIETALGGALQHVVVASERDAKAAIEYLRRRRGGRATFLPLDGLKPRTPPAETVRALAEHSGAVGLASELVRTDPRHRIVVDYLLARTAVVYELDAALRLSSRLRGSGVSRIVTESGDLLIPGGAITGGEAARRGAGEAWARRREQAKLAETLARKRAEWEEAQAAHRELELAVERAERALLQVEDELQRSEAERADVSETAERARAERARAEAAHRRAEEDLARLVEAKGKEEGALREAAGDVSHREAEQSEAERRVAAAEEAVGAAKARAESTAGELGDLKVALARKEAERDRVQAAWEERQKELARAARTDEEDARRLEALDARARELEAHLEQLKRRLEELEAQRSASADSYDRLRERRRALAESIAEASKEEARRRAESAEKEQALQRLHVDEAEWEGRRARLKDRLDDLVARDRLSETLSREDARWATVVSEVAAAADAEGLAGRPDTSPGARAETEAGADWPAAATDGSEEGATGAAGWSPMPMSPALADDPPPPDSDRWEAWERECEQALRALRLRISGMGAVNPNAVSELREERDRMAFLTRQRDDLVQAKASILEAVQEIDETAKARLLETYLAVRGAFAELFSKLFGGGAADLQFVDPDRPLESGLEVRAQPPGKRTQNLMALSGGERTLTAIALVFAAFRVKPTPFCVLDEIDAALDESNLDRFAGLLRLFSGQAQFIVITHRPRTMEEADNLYGVTMEESGVSKLVSVRLSAVDSSR